MLVGNIRSFPGGVFTASANNREFIASRGADIPGEVLRGEADVGFCGSDVIGEICARGLGKSLGFIAVKEMGCRLSLITAPDEPLDQPLRVATSFPALSKKLLSDAGYVQEYGGKVEGKIKNGFFNALVDIVESGDTVRDNGLVERCELVNPLETGIVFRKEAVDLATNTFPLVEILNVITNIAERKKQLEMGIQFDPEKKSTLSLLASENKRVKALGEEIAEFERAIIRGEGEVEEAADVLYTVFTALTANGKSPLEVFNELAKRNQ